MNRIRFWTAKHWPAVVEVLLHALAWALFLFFFYASTFGGSNNTSFRLTYLSIIVALDVPIFYWLYLHAIPKLLANKQPWVFTACILLVCGIYPFLKYGLDLLLLKSFPNQTTSFLNLAQTRFWTVYGLRALACLFVVAMAGVGRFTFDWFKNERIKKELEKQNLISELAFLKSQINPHFLFNTLNNIHTLAYKKAEGAPEAIMKLSELMRYMIYESDEDFVPLKKEIQHLKSFVDLHELRFKTKGIVQMNISGNLHQQRVAPLILIPFIENAFKHGHNLNRKGSIKVMLSLNGELQYEVENDLPPFGLIAEKDKVGGIGLENIKRRLELIYPESHEIKVERRENKFNVKLTLRSYG